jgi:hypothetical protein
MAAPNVYTMTVKVNNYDISTYEAGDQYPVPLATLGQEDIEKAKLDEQEDTLNETAVEHAMAEATEAFGEEP